MKIGIITFHDTTNFGSLLQTYGLYKGIQRLGYNCEIIDYKCKAICDRELPRLRTVQHGLKAYVKHLLFDEKKAKYRELHRFLTLHMHLGPKCDVSNTFKLNDIYDKFVVGSDIVWGTDITDCDTTYFLDFVNDDQKKFAFSSSVGNPWSSKEKSLLRPYLSSFSHIAVREVEAADWVSELTGVRPDVVCDPTMLLDAEEWRTIKSDRYSKDKYILVYFDSPQNECLKAAIKYGQENRIKVYFINYGIPVRNTHTIRPYSLEDFLSLVYYAQRVFTASYHGMLFSIYFNKQFLFFNRSHKSRMNTLAQKLNVIDCDGSNIETNSLPIIDYRMVDELVESYRQSSYSILLQLLSK